MNQVRWLTLANMLIASGVLLILAWLHKPVTLIIDGESTEITTYCLRVGELLQRMHVEISVGDQVTLPLTALCGGCRATRFLVQFAQTRNAPEGQQRHVKLTVNLLFISALAFGQPAEFVANYYPIAKQVGDRYGIAAEVILTQAAFETGWGKNVKGNNFFGLKGRGQLCRTTEYHSTTTVKYPHIFSISETAKGYKYVVLDHFRCYDYPIDSFEDYAVLVKKIGKNHCSPYKQILTTSACEASI